MNTTRSLLQGVVGLVGMSRYAQGPGDTEDMHGLYCLELGILGEDNSERKASFPVWVFVLFCLVLLRWVFIQPRLAVNLLVAEDD